MKGRRFQNPGFLFFAGLLSGILAKLLDAGIESIGALVSPLSFWILTGTLLSVYSPSKKNAMRNLFSFCIGVLIPFLVISCLIRDSRPDMLRSLTEFTAFSPVFACFAWMTKEEGRFPKYISLGIVLLSVLSSILLSHRLCFLDYFLDGILLYFLFFKKVPR